MKTYNIGDESVTIEILEATSMVVTGTHEFYVLHKRLLGLGTYVGVQAHLLNDSEVAVEAGFFMEIPPAEVRTPGILLNLVEIIRTTNLDLPEWPSENDHVVYEEV